MNPTRRIPAPSASPARLRLAVLALAALALGGCDFAARARSDAKHAEHSRRIEELDARVTKLEIENRELRRELAEARTRAPDGGASPAADTRLVARCSGTEPHFRLSRADADAVAANLAGLATEVRIVPHFENGRSDGFKLFAIRPDSFIASCGFRNGDVLHAVNGMAIHTPDTALEAYTKARTADALDLALTRAGAPVSVRITVE